MNGTKAESVDVTIVVCTHNNAGLLRDCLASILADRSAATRELLVVDNGSTDDTVAAVAEFVGVRADVPVRYVVEPKLGHSHARNCGVAHARGRLLLFTDDDVLVSNGWTDALASAFADPEVGAAGGRTLPIWPIPPPEWLNGPHMGRLSLLDFGTTSRRLLEHEVPVGANMAVRTALARSFPTPFEVDLGHQNGRRFGYEETLLLNRIRERLAIGYAADAVVHHQIDVNRMTLDWMRHTYFDMGIGLARSERHESLAEPTFARRVVRTYRVLKGTARQRRTNDARPRTGPETWAELLDYMWAGKHSEMLFRRFPRLTGWIGKVIA